MNHFYTLKVAKIQKVTDEAVKITFEIPSSIQDKFKFKQGQYLNLKFNFGEEEFRRSYSIIDAPSENSQTLSILVKQMENGTISTFLNQNLKENDEVEVQQPMGNFCTNYHASNQKNYIGIAAGSGISPVLSNLKEALFQEPNAKVLLFFGNKNSQNILLKEELDALKERFPERFQVTHVLSREPQEDALFEGRITTEKLGQLLDKNSEIKPEDSTFFICGPTEMIKSTSDFLKKERKVPALQVLYEYFSAPDDEDNAEMSEEFKKIPNLESFVTLIIDDDEYSIHLNSKKESILDKALKENLPVPFACKGGVCCTCKAQVMEGEVFMEKNFALTEDEVARGFVLTCQCHPTTNIVMLNYDV